MTIETLKNALPDYAKDIRLNLSNLADEETLNEQQRWGCFLSCAHAVGTEQVVREIENIAAARLSPEAANAARAAAAIMGMNNIYYRFVHLSSSKEYQAMSSRLRMNIIGNPGVDKKDFELWSLAVSAINGCGMCIDSHERKLFEDGVTREQIQCAVRIAAVVNAVSAVLRAEDALAPALERAA